MKTTDDHFYEDLGSEFQYQQILMLKKALADGGIASDKAKEICGSFTFSLAMLFDQGTLEVDGKSFRPKLAFVADDELWYLQSEMFEFTTTLLEMWMRYSIGNDG